MTQASPPTPSQQPRSPFRRFVLDNLGWLLVSLALASVIWYAAVSAQNPVEQRRFTQRVPVEIRTDPGMLIVNRPQQLTALVTIRALRSAWNEIATENISVVADLSGLGPGVYNVELVGALAGVRGGAVVSVDPRTASLELQRREEKRVNVEVQFAQEPPVGYTANATSAEPTALVSGPAASVEKVAAAVARISVGERRTGFSQDVTLLAVDAAGETVADVTLTPAEMRIDVAVQQRPDVSELNVEPRIVGEAPDGYVRGNYNWQPKRIIVRGDQDAIAAMNGSVSTEPIDLTGRIATFSETVHLVLPDGVTMPDPTDVTVTVEIEPVVVTREFANIGVQSQGMDPADYRIVIQPERVNVLVRGPQAIVDGLTPEDVSVYAPLSGLPPGTHTVTLIASVSDASIRAENVTIPNDQATVIIESLEPTRTPTRTPRP
ncbi:MAG: hypothetical protein IT323_09005 [Anaerolineae bacterium]|nr:hypothetical protein [Anaerolineae bacterium]